MIYVPNSMSKLDTKQNMFCDNSWSTFGVDSLKLWGQTISQKNIKLLGKIILKFKSKYAKISIKSKFKLKMKNVAFSTAATVYMGSNASYVIQTRAGGESD